MTMGVDFKRNGRVLPFLYKKMVHCFSFKLRSALVLVLGFVSGPVLFASDLAFNEARAPATKEDLMAIQKALMESSERVREATVSISIGDGFGSGVIVSEEGLVLTAAHVTAAVGKELTVIMNDGTELKGVSMGLVANSDAAMMRITEEGEYPFVEINRDNNYRIGHWVFALGHSGGFDKSRGPVLRLGRILKDSESTVHTDCKVIGGDSGGPLFDMEGRLIAIHSRVATELEGNMHIPMREYVKHWEGMQTDEFIGEGPFAQKPVKGSGYLGVGTEDSDDGLRIVKIGKDSPAEKEGLKVDDVILALNDQEVSDKSSLKAILAEMAEGDSLEVKVLREKEELVIKVELAKR